MQSRPCAPRPLQETREHPRALDAAGKDKLLPALKEAGRMLEVITKGLSDYLELKRLAFPRLFFLRCVCAPSRCRPTGIAVGHTNVLPNLYHPSTPLAPSPVLSHTCSNDELLEILSQTKDPRAVQPHLGKCFEGIARVRFRGEAAAGSGGVHAAGGSDMTITHILSAEGEAVPLARLVDPEAGANRGCVEAWLTELQMSMRLTLKSVIAAAAEAYTSTPRAKWVLQWPGQVVLNVSQLHWTREVEAALASGGSKALAGYSAQLATQLADIVGLVRGELTKLQRATLGALTVIDVHARDVVAGMVTKRVERAGDFEWAAQLRYYWEHKPDEYKRYGDDPYNLVARIVGASQGYCYEYLGSSSRLVITPLTDRLVVDASGTWD